MSRVREGTVIGEKYRLERPLARGGMGEIWIARHLQLDMPVAVKFMDAAFAATTEGRTRFEREAKAVALIQSPHIVHVHDYGIHEDHPYMAMELLRGEDLGTRMRRDKQLRLPFLASVVTQVCKALKRAHDAGIIHRDLKPANVYLANDDDEQIVKVLDFGVAKLIGMGAASEATQTGVVVGSVHYMSPEQARGLKEIDHRADLWSLGVIIYRALTAHLPFPGDQMGDVIVKICSEPLPLASSFRHDLGPEIDAFFVRAFARPPDERFQSARELGQAFAAIAAARVDSPSAADHRLSLPSMVGGSASPSGISSASSSATPGPATPPIAPIFPPPPSVGTLTTASQSNDVAASPEIAGARKRGLVVVGSVVAAAIAVALTLLLRGGGEPARPAVAPVTTTSAAPTTSPLPQAVATVDAPAASVSASAKPEETAKPTAATAKPAAPRTPQKKINSELGF